MIDALGSERAVLGAALESASVLSAVAQVLTSTDFTDHRHRCVWDALTALADANSPTDPHAVHNQLVASGTALRVGGAGFLHELIAAAPLATDATYHADIIVEKARLRALNALGSRLSDATAAQSMPVTDVIATAFSELDALATGASSADVIHVGDTVAETVEFLESTNEPGLATGLADLDRMLSGLQPGQMIILGARPGVGKSTLGLSIAEHVAVRLREPTLFFSLEMSVLELNLRLLSSQTRVPLSVLRNKQVTDQQWLQVADKLSELASAPLFFDASVSQGIAAMKAKARRMQARHGLGLIVIDYLQLMSSAGRVESRQQEVSAMSRGIKVMAKELGVPVIAMSQLNRGLENRADRRPQLSDLRESGSIEQDSDIVIFLHREEHGPDGEPSERAGEVDLIVAKHRNGATGTITAAWQGEFSRVTNLAY